MPAIEVGRPPPSTLISLSPTAFEEGHGQEVDTQGDAFLVAFHRASSQCDTSAMSTWWATALFGDRRPRSPLHPSHCHPAFTITHAPSSGADPPGMATHIG